MEYAGSPYRIVKRKLKKKSVYYARFFDSAGKLIKTLSTHETNRYRAEQWARNHLFTESASSVTVADLAVRFWDINGTYAQGRLVRGKSISRGHLEISEGYTKNHILPKWGKVAVADITVGAVDSWILELYRAGEFAPATINKILQAFRCLLDGAVLQDYLPDNPAKAVKPLKAEHSKRGVLTDIEVKKLLGKPDNWKDYRQYVINLIAFYTGARIGEIRGLTIEHVKPDRIEIVQAWEEGHGLKEPKFNSKRAVPIPPHIYEAVQRVIEDRQPENLVFFSDAGKERPLSKTAIESSLYRALKKIGIDEKQRRERGITFHSWRHKLTTTLRAKGVPDSIIRKLTGHRDEAMTDWYTNFNVEDFDGVLSVQGDIISFRKIS